MIPRQIAPGVSWTGAVDWDRRLFDALIPLPEGTSYNAYLVQGKDKTALIDTVEPTKRHLLESQLEAVPRVDYVIANHAEQDHSGSIPWVLEKYPEAKILCSALCQPMLDELLCLDPGRVRPVADGETLSLGGKTLRFITTPWVHWPETMSTFLEEDGILFSCDFFGSHLATSRLFIEEGHSIYDQAKRYFAEIMLPFRRTIEKNLDKLRGLDLRVIAPSHGPLYKQPQVIIDAYRDWVGETPRNSAIIVWTSMHGSTEVMVEHLTAALAERGVAVHPFNMAVSDIGRLAIELVDAATLIVACPTVHAGPHPAVLEAVHLANALRPKVRFASVVTSYGWGGKTVDIIKSLIPNLKVEFLEPLVVKGYPREKDFQALTAMAEAVAGKHGDLGLK